MFSNVELFAQRRYIMPLDFRGMLYVTDRLAELGIAVAVTLAVTLGIALIIIRVHLEDEH